MNKIDLFRGDNAFLSNFWPCQIDMDGETYATVEHAYQASKTFDEKQRTVVRNSRTPSKAKLNGKYVTKRPNWENIKIEVMKRLLWQKFGDGLLKYLLLETNDAELIEGNNWNDTFWGVCGGHGDNNLGKLLMEIREELKAK